MKKILFILAIAACAFACSPKIVIDAVHKGDRVICTSDSRLYQFQGNQMSCALGIKASPKDTVLGLVVVYDGDTGVGVFSQGDKMYITLNDGTEFALSNLYDKEYESKSEVQTRQVMRNDYTYAYSYSPYVDDFYLTPVTVSRWLPEVYTMKITKSYGLYLITKSQFAALVKKGAKKVFIEAANGDSEMPRPEDFSKLLLSQFNMIVERLQKK